MDVEDSKDYKDRKKDRVINAEMAYIPVCIEYSDFKKGGWKIRINLSLLK